MLLTETNIIHYLLDNIPSVADSFIKGNYTCRGYSGRHRHFIVNKEWEGLFIKQALPGDEEKTGFIQRENLFYRTVASNENYYSISPYLPDIAWQDEKNAAIVLKYYSASIDLGSWLMKNKEQVIIKQVAGKLAQALYSLHSIEMDNETAWDEIKPWILEMVQTKNEGKLTGRSAAEQQSIDLIFSLPGFAELIAEAAQYWQATGIIHGDSKLGNFLVFDTGDLKWIDWEIVAAGDPLWDMATVFQSVLTNWVVSQDPLFNSENKKGISSTCMQEFISSCWEKYTLCNGWDTMTANKKLEKCIAFTSLRVLHSCFETTPNAKNLQPYSARLLQLAHNILSNPAQACTGLFGINPGS